MKKKTRDKKLEDVTSSDPLHYSYTNINFITETLIMHNYWNKELIVFGRYPFVDMATSVPCGIERGLKRALI